MQPHRGKLPRSFSTAGLVAMLIGLGLVAFELRYSLLLYRLGMLGRIVLFVCGTGFSVWGLKELIANWWPQLGRRGFGRHRSGLSAEGWIYVGIMIVLFAGALFGRSNPLLLVFAMMAGPFVVNGWVSFVLLKRLSVERKVPRRVMAGESTSVEIVLRNGKRWISAWVITLRDQITGGSEPLTAQVLVTRVAPRTRRSAHYRLRLMDRGEYEIGPMSVSTRFPLGLVERGLSLPRTDRILVYPRIGRLTSQWSERLQNASDLVPQMTPRSGPFDDEYHKLREYRVGDDPRAIHWKTTARRNELMVREFRESRDRQLAVLIDPWLPARATDADRELAELAISFGATIAIQHLRNSREAHLMVTALGLPGVNWKSGGGDLDALLDGLARLQPSTRSAFSGFTVSQGMARRRPTRAFLISTRARAAHEWLRQGEISAADGGEALLESIRIIAADSEQLAAIVDWR
jgi:uncharacterized protein (DUF58 family)